MAFHVRCRVWQERAVRMDDVEICFIGNGVSTMGHIPLANERQDINQY